MKPLLLLLILLSTQSFAQISLRGKVTDGKGNALPGVNIILKNTYDGASSDSDGNYSFETDTKGKQTIIFQSIGFKSIAIEISIEDREIVTNVKLAEQINVLNAVTISAGSLDANDQKKAVVLKPIDIVTTSGAMGDITGALHTLPGNASVGNDGRLFVRGGDASETNMYIDGLQVGNAFGSTVSGVPTRTRFSSNLFKGTFFSTGGYSAEYGQALSSALSLNTIDMPLRNQGDISVMSVGGGYTQTLVGKNNALTASANYMNLKPYQALVKQNFDWERSPSGWDSEISLRHKIDNRGKESTGIIKAYFHTEGNGMTIWQPQPGQEGRGLRVKLDNRYNYGNISFRQTYKNGWTYYGGGAYSSSKDQIERGADHFEIGNNVGHLKAVAVKDFPSGFSLKNGIETYLKTYAEKHINANLTRRFSDNQFNYFSEADYFISNSLVLRAGLRFGYSSLAKQSWLTPRGSLAYRFANKGQVSFASGIFKQLPVEKLRVLNNNLKNTEATHYILNYFYAGDSRTFRAEAFYKNYSNLATFKGTAENPIQITENGNGYARGFDFFYRDKKSIQGMDFWLTYSFVDSRRSYATYETRIQPSFAPKHNGSAVLKRFVTSLKSQLGASWVWNSGYTYDNPNIAGEMESKTKMYSDLSVSWSYLPKPNVIIHMACSNVLGRNNIFGYQYAETPNETGHFASLPAGQGAKRFLFLGVFITLSKDKNANQLNNM